MKIMAILILAAVFMGPAAAQNEDGSPPREFDTYWVVFWERGEKRDEYSDDQRAGVQTKHLAHLGAMRKSGKMLVAGPLEVGPEEPMRGICLYRGDLARDEVEELAGADPAVKAGVLSVRVIKWWMPKGGLAFGKPDQ